MTKRDSRQRPPHADHHWPCPCVALAKAMLMLRRPPPRTLPAAASPSCFAPVLHAVRPRSRTMTKLGRHQARAERERETGSSQRDTGRTPPARPLPRRLCHPSPLQPTLRRRPPIADVIADAVAPSSTSSMPRPDLESDLARLCRIHVLHHHRHEAITVNAAAGHPSHASSSTPPAVQPRPLPSRRSPSPDLAV